MLGNICELFRTLYSINQLQDNIINSKILGFTNRY